jgi:hypothetical protein
VAGGSEVSITPIDTGRGNSSSGVLSSMDAMRAGQSHRNDRVGEVVVHFRASGAECIRFAETQYRMHRTAASINLTCGLWVVSLLRIKLKMYSGHQSQILAHAR